MDRQQLIKEISYVALDSNSYTTAQIDQAVSILARLTSHQIGIAQAEAELNQLKSQSTRLSYYWRDKYKSKVVYDALVKYLKGSLSSNEIAKMISSLITHSFIELDKNPNVSPDDLGIKELSEILDGYISSGFSKIDQTKLTAVLHKYGYIITQEEGD